MVAHNAAFDVDMLKKEGIELKNGICTLKLTRYFDKKGVIPKYGLQYLRYYLKLNVDAVPHTALGDILVLEALFDRIYAKAVIEFGDDAVSKMIEVSKNPVLYPTLVPRCRRSQARGGTGPETWGPSASLKRYRSGELFHADYL